MFLTLCAFRSHECTVEGAFRSHFCTDLRVSIQHVNTCVLRRAAVRALYCVCTPHTRLPRHCHFSIACHLTFQSNSVFSNFVYFFRPDMTLGFKYGSTTAETDGILHNRRGDGTCYYRQNILLLELIFQSNSEKYL